MKNIAKITTVLSFLFLTGISLAKEPTLNVSPSSDAKSFILSMDASSNGAKIKLIDAQQNVIYSQKISEGSFSKKFNLENLEDGLYFLTADEALVSYSYTIEVLDNKLSLIKTDEDVKPYFRKTSNMVYMNMLNLEKGDVSIKVYDENNREVYSQKVTDEMIVEKAFNFKDAYDGEYTLIVSSTDNTYTEKFVVN